MAAKKLAQFRITWPDDVDSPVDDDLLDKEPWGSCPLASLMQPTIMPWAGFEEQGKGCAQWYAEKSSYWNRPWWRQNELVAEPRSPSPNGSRSVPASIGHLQNYAPSGTAPMPANRIEPLPATVTGPLAESLDIEAKITEPSVVNSAHSGAAIEPPGHVEALPATETGPLAESLEEGSSLPR